MIVVTFKNRMMTLKCEDEYGGDKWHCVKAKLIKLLEERLYSIKAQGLCVCCYEPIPSRLILVSFVRLIDRTFVVTVTLFSVCNTSIIISSFIFT
ncbi:hypothetical protein QVD17_02698 [Tagetes erecta]|uniref:Uncharacterized protein n=1 Tax=Tagetes erecta TaxID=13708 RepID=A0AAD8L9Y1_TARER|nr:hypothetical protein QVD17_02698 [Tagetes erecta]